MNDGIVVSALDAQFFGSDTGSTGNCVPGIGHGFGYLRMSLQPHDPSMCGRITVRRTPLAITVLAIGGRRNCVPALGPVRPTARCAF